MKVNNQGIKQIYQMDLEEARPTGRSRPSAEKSSASGLERKDQAELSESARLLAKALNEADSTPAARAEQVRQLKEQVEAGTYESPYDELARRLLAHVRPGKEVES